MGGGSYGPRLLADITPFLCLYLYPPFGASPLKTLLKSTITVLLALSIGLHALEGIQSVGTGMGIHLSTGIRSGSGRGPTAPVYYGRNTLLDVVAAVKRRVLGSAHEPGHADKLAAYLCPDKFGAGDYTASG